MADMLQHMEVGEIVNLLDIVSGIAARDIHDPAFLLTIAHDLAIPIPEDLKGNRRAIKNRILQFLNGDVVTTLPGISDVLLKLRGDLNLHLFPDDLMSDDDKGGVSESVDEEEDSGNEMSRRGAGRGITVPNAYTAALSDVGRASRHGVENRPRRSLRDLVY